MRYKLTIAYDGTRYCGWQVQDTGTSIQSLIQAALETILRHPVTLSGSGRTDAKVHARGQIAHFDTEQTLDPYRFCYSLNALLPEDIRILLIEPTSPDFHARYSAQSKTYHYHLQVGPVADPFRAPYTVHIPYPLNIDLLRTATQHFIGTHDFTSFANEAHRGSAAKDPVRTLTRFDVIQQDNLIRFELEADGFLYKMVRNLVGTVLDVARGKLALKQIPEILAAKDRSKASPAAPPHGLFLMHVQY